MSYGSHGDPNPPTPAFANTHDWIYYYLVIHQLSPPSYRYAYLLWFSIVLFLLVFGTVDLVTGSGMSHGVLSARWHKWSIQRPSLVALFSRKMSASGRSNTGVPRPQRKSREPYWWKIKFAPSPTYGELLALLVLAVAVTLSCILGADYIKPTTSTFDFVHNTKRRLHGLPFGAVVDLVAAWDYKINPVSPPGYTIHKAWWTAGGRTGLVAFALFPLCVVAILKAPPFAVFALRFPAHVYSDKLGWLHRWTGRFIFGLTTAHVALWSVQLARDRRVGINGGGIAWIYAFDYDKFIFGIIAFVCMTLLVMLSFPSFRHSDFELFYAIHVILVLLTMIFSSLHYPPLGPWCWAPLGLWALERTWRLMRTVRINGNPLESKVPTFPPPQAFPIPSTGQYQLPHPESDSLSGRSSLACGGSAASTMNSSRGIKGFRGSNDDSPSASADDTTHFTFPPTPRQSVNPDDLTTIIPPGCGRVELLPGRTIRLTVRPKRRISYAPGQYAILAFPLLSRFTGHPFTIVSSFEYGQSSSRGVDLEASTRIPAPTKAGRDVNQFLEFIIRARQGLTLDLWNHFLRTRTHDPHTGKYIPPILRVRVDAPYGSAVRVKWTSYGSVLVVVGGSGVAFGLALLGHLCRAIRDADKKLREGSMREEGIADQTKRDSMVNLNILSGKAKVMTTRLRFVWLVREYSHLMWCATNLRRFLQMVAPNMLQIDIFVTNFAPNISRSPRSDLRALQQVQTMDEDGSLVPPSLVFTGSSKPKQKQSSSRASSVDSSEDSDSAWSSDDSIVDRSYAKRYRHDGTRASALSEHLHRRATDDGASYHGLYSDIDDGEDDLGDGRHFVVGLTNFEGEEDERERDEQSSARVKRQGQHVRRKTLVNIKARQLQQQHHNSQSHQELHHHHPPHPPHQSQSPPPHRVAPPPLRKTYAPYALVEEENADIGESVTAALSPTGSPGKTNTRLPDSTAGPSSPRTRSQPLSRSISPPNIPRIALDTRVHSVRLDTQVSAHSPLSPQYQSSHYSRHSHAEHLASATRYQTLSPPPGHQRRVRPEYAGHARRLSTRISVAESLYSQYGGESPTNESAGGHHHSDSQSLRELLSASEAHLATRRDAGFGALDYLFNLSAQEREDMGYIAALARSGRPRLDKILVSEVERSSGAVAVACCGPSSLDAVVRKLVSSQIGPSRVRKGDQRGFITFYNEEFSF